MVENYNRFALTAVAIIRELMDDNLHSLSRRLIELRIEHGDLDSLIDQASLDRPDDELVLRRLKKRRLSLRDALQLPIGVALLKGRASYLCLHRMKQARQSSQLPDRWAVRTLAKVEQWSQSTSTGDLAEMEGLDERSSVIPLVTSSRENCL